MVIILTDTAPSNISVPRAATAYRPVVTLQDVTIVTATKQDVTIVTATKQDVTIVTITKQDVTIVTATKQNTRYGISIIVYKVIM